MGKSRAGCVIVVILVLLALVVILGVAALTGYFSQKKPAGKPSLSSVETKSAKTVADKADVLLFNTTCARCHGEDGSRKPAWRAKVSAMTTEQIVNTIRDGRGPMPSFSDKLTKDEIERLAAYSSLLSSM